MVCWIESVATATDQTTNAQLQAPTTNHQPSTPNSRLPRPTTNDQRLTARRHRFAVHHPRNPEPILRHAEADRPERLLEGHLGHPTFSQLVEDPLAVCERLRRDRHVDALRLLIPVGRCVGPHQRGAVDFQRDVHDEAVLVGRNAVLHLRLAERLQELDLAAEAALVEPERLGAVAVEVQIGGEHHFLPKCCFSCSTTSAGAFGKSSISKYCRISTSGSRPALGSCANGIFFAHSMASAFDLTLMIQ